MKNRGVDVLITDCLLGPVLFMGAVDVAYICARLSPTSYLTYTSPEYNASTGDDDGVCVFDWAPGLSCIF